jgi:hypothetical protein
LSIYRRFGAWYAFNETSQTFELTEGETFPYVDSRTQERVELPVDYPQTVNLVEGTHPEVFCANGSHGTWGAEGGKMGRSLVLALHSYYSELCGCSILFSAAASVGSSADLRPSGCKEKKLFLGQNKTWLERLG